MKKRTVVLLIVIFLLSAASCGGNSGGSYKGNINISGITGGSTGSGSNAGSGGINDDSGIDPDGFESDASIGDILGGILGSGGTDSGSNTGGILSSGLRSGVYVFYPDGEIYYGTGACVELMEHDKFSISFAIWSGYEGTGKYKVSGDTLLLDAGEYHYAFKIVEEGLMFDAENSSTMLWGSEISDGDILIYEGEDYQY